MSFIPGDQNTSQQQKTHIERQSAESSSNNESFRSTPKGSPDLSLFTPKDNNGDIKIKSFVAASGSDDFLYDSDDSENNSQKRVKVSTPLQKMKKSQQDFPEKRHKHRSHQNKQNDNSTSENTQSNDTKSPKNMTSNKEPNSTNLKNNSPKNQTNLNKNILSRGININNENAAEDPFAEFDDQSPKMLSSSSVQTGEENTGNKKQNAEHEVLMVPRNNRAKKPKLVDKETQVKYHIVNRNETPEHKVETVQTRNVEQFEIDFDDTDSKSKNSATNREEGKANDKKELPKPQLDNNIIQSPKQRSIEIKDSDKRKSPKQSEEIDKGYAKGSSPRQRGDNDKQSPRHYHEDDREYNQRKSPRHRNEDEDYDRQKSPKRRHDDDRRKSPRHRHDDDDYDRRKSPRHRNEYDDEDYGRRKSPRHRHEDEREYDRRKSPRHRHEDDDYDRRKSPRHRDEYEDEDYGRRKSPRHRHEDDREYNKRRSPRHRDEYEYEDYDRRKSPRRRDDYEDENYDRRKSPRHRDEYEDEDYGRRKSPRHRHEDDRKYSKERSPRHRDDYRNDDNDRRKSPKHRRDDDREYDRPKSPKNRNKDRYDNSKDKKARDDKQNNNEIPNDKQLINNQQDFSSSNSIDRLADSIQPNTMTRRDIPLNEMAPLESPTKATQTIDNDVFEREFDLPENEVDESGEGLRLLSSIFNDISSSSIVPNNDTVGRSAYQQRVNGSIEKAKMLREITIQKPPKLADISIQIDMTEDEMQEELLSSSFDKKLREVDLEYDNNSVKERNINLNLIPQNQELSEGSDNDKNNSFNFILSENDEDENRPNQASAQKVPSKVKLSTENIDLGKYSSKASFRSKSGDFTIAPNFTEDSISSIQQPPESEKNLMPLSEGLQAIEASVDQTKTRETLSAAMSSIDLYTEEEEESDSQPTNSNKYSFGENVKERGFGQFKLNIQSDSSKKSQRSEANPNELTNENSFSQMSDIPKSPRTQESMLSNEKLLSQSSNSNESHHSNKSNQSKQSHQSYQSTKSNQSHHSTKSNQSHQSEKSNQSHQSEKSNQSHQSEKSNQSHQSEKSNHSLQSQKSNQSNQTNKSNQSAKSNHSNKLPQSQQSADAPKSAFSVIYSELETDEMNKPTNKTSPFTRKSKPLSSSERIDPNSASLSSVKTNLNPQSPTLNRGATLDQNNNNDNINKSGFSSQSFSHSPPINDDDEDELNNISSERSANIFMKNKDIHLTSSEESSLLQDFPGDSINNKPEKRKSDFPLKSSPVKPKPSKKVVKKKKENSKIDQNEQILESNSHSNIEFVKNRNINLKQTDESSLINDFPGDTYNNNYSENKEKPTKETNKQLDFPRVTSKPNTKTTDKKEQSPKTKPKSPKKKENSKCSEIIQLQASDYSENSRPIFNLDGDNSENISKKLKSLKIQNSSSLSSSLSKNVQNQRRMMEEKEDIPDSQSYESAGSNKNKNKVFQPITLNQLSSESDSFNNKQKNGENKVLQLNDLDDNSSISDNFSNRKNSSKTKTNANNVSKSNQQKNYFNDNDEKASSSNEGKE